MVKGATIIEVPKDSTQKYTVTAYSKDGCESTDTIKVYVIKVPKVITPDDNKGKNNLFQVIDFPEIAADIQEVTVINRWGEVVYTATNNNGWDGSYTVGKDDYVPSDVYIYQLKAKMKNNGTIVLLRGEVMVLR